MCNSSVFVLLAGGRSQRMGTAKGLLNYHGSFWILEQLKRIASAEINTVYIGLGHNHQIYFEAIDWFKAAVTDYVIYRGLKVKIIINPAPQLGSFSTLQHVFKTLAANCSVLINPIDVPILNQVELNQIIATKNSVVFPSLNYQKGHPIKLAADFWQPLTTLATTADDARLDFQLNKLCDSKISYVCVNDRVITKNLNTPEQWHEFVENA
jgi:CTP:molybdopterin cytidylyltransferase MocA